MSRKTFSVDEFRIKCNNLVARMDGDTEANREYRHGVLTMLEGVLHETGNYRGFGYLVEGTFTGKGRPGVIYGDNGKGVQVPHPDYTVRFDPKTTDDTRVYYY